MKTCEGFGRDCEICGAQDCDADEGMGFGEGLFIGFVIGAGIISAIAFYYVS